MSLRAALLMLGMALSASTAGAAEQLFLKPGAFFSPEGTPANEMVEQNGLYYAFGGYPQRPGPAWIHNTNDGFRNATAKVPAAGWVCDRPDQPMIDVERGGLSYKCPSSWEVGCFDDIEHGRFCGLNSSSRYNGVPSLTIILDKDVCFPLHTSTAQNMFLKIDQHAPEAVDSNCLTAGTPQHKRILDQLNSGRVLRLKYYVEDLGRNEEVVLDVTTFSTAYKMLIWMKSHSE